MKKVSVLLMSASVFTVFSSAALANGVTQGKDVATRFAQALGENTLLCNSNTDQVTITPEEKNVLRMIAHYSGEISGALNSDNEGSGSECGGLVVKFDSQYSSYILDDSYNDCERGDWGYRIMITQKSMDSIRDGSTHFAALSYDRDQDTNDGPIRNLECEVK